MKRFYTNAAVKFLAFCLTALFSVGAVMLAFGAVNFAEQGCVPGQRYEDSAAYRSIMSGYIISAANLYRMQGEDLENSGLSFVDQQERQASWSRDWQAKRAISALRSAQRMERRGSTRTFRMRKALTA